MVAIPGTEPRHLAFHPNAPFAYLLSEVASTLTTLRFDAATGKLTPIQIVSSVPDTSVLPSWASEIVITSDGRFVYASNRANDSIGVFSVSPIDGRLTAVEWVSSGGHTPRNFALSPDNRFMFVGNEDSDGIASFMTDPQTGRLSRAGAPLKVGSPVCILLIPPPRML